MKKLILLPGCLLLAGISVEAFSQSRSNAGDFSGSYEIKCSSGELEISFGQQFLNANQDNLNFEEAQLEYLRAPLPCDGDDFEPFLDEIYSSCLALNLVGIDQEKACIGVQGLVNNVVSQFDITGEIAFAVDDEGSLANRFLHLYTGKISYGNERELSFLLYNGNNSRNGQFTSTMPIGLPIPFLVPGCAISPTWSVNGQIHRDDNFSLTANLSGKLNLNCVLGASILQELDGQNSGTQVRLGRIGLAIKAEVQGERL